MGWLLLPAVALIGLATLAMALCVVRGFVRDLHDLDDPDGE